MKTKWLFAFFALCLFTGCTDDDERPEPVEKTYLLHRKTSEISMADGSQKTIEWKYTYDEDNRLDRIDVLTTSGSETKNLGTVLNYNSKGYLSQVLSETGRIWSIYYNSQNRPIEQVEKYREAMPLTYINRFDPYGKLLVQELYAGNEAAANLISVTKLTYTKANEITLRRTLASGEVAEEAKVVTDDKSRPLPMLLDQAFLAFQPSGVVVESLLTEHNVISYEDLAPESADDNGNRSFTTNYIYNEAGYPIASDRQFASGVVETSSYSYLVKEVKRD